MNIEEKVRITAEEVDFSGVISITKGKKNLLSLQRGYQDLARKIPIKGNTNFAIASGTKAFTALAMGRQLEEEKLYLQSTMMEIFQKDLGFIHPRATVEDLLCHQSGIYDYYDEELIEDFDNFDLGVPWYKIKDSKDYLPFMLGQSMKFVPQERVSYSNGGYVFLGILIEKFTGKSFQEVVEEEVLQRAGMKNSGFWSFNDLPDNTALGYKEEGGRLVSNIYALPIRGAGDGGMYSNAKDMASFWRSLNKNKILNEENTQDFLSPRVENFWEGVNYGLGFYLADNCQFLVGCDAGVGFQSRYYPPWDVVFTVMSNRTEGEEKMLPVLDQFLDAHISD